MLEPIDVGRLIDGRGISRFAVGVVVFAFFILLVDGYDISVSAFAGPALAKAWNVEPSSLGPMLSASLVGILLGAPLFGYIGDRQGRRRALIWALWTAGIGSILCATADGLGQLTLMRYLAGFGIGGVLPNVTALVAEYAPARYRATLVIVAFSGISLGGSLPGLVAATIVPLVGWQSLFAVAAALPILAALACFVALPESIKFLAVQKTRSAEIAEILKKIAPEVTVEQHSVFGSPNEPEYAPFTPGMLFSGQLKVITPLLWLLFGVNLFVNYMLLSWTPIALTRAGAPITDAALATSLYQLGGTVGALTLCRPIDLRGFAPIAVLFTIAIVIFGGISYLGLRYEWLLLMLQFFAGFCVLGLQFGLYATASILYPTAFRSNGIGWAIGIGRLGSVFGPLLGSLIIGAGFGMVQLNAVATVGMALGAITCFGLLHVYHGRSEGLEPAR
jgi:AAHS family 4-hydroxybenzoate transporter-like MFS transporter